MTSDTMTATMWLHLLACRQALTALELAPVAGTDRRAADRMLHMAAKKGIFRPVKVDGRKNARGYTVDAACVIPRGLTLDQVLKARGDAPQPEAEPIELPQVRDGQRTGPRGELGHLGRVPSVFAMGQA